MGMDIQGHVRKNASSTGHNPVRAILVAITILVLLSVPACDSDNAGKTSETETGSVGLSADASDSLRIELRGLDSVTVLDLLQAQHEVATKSSAMGVFVTAIDSLESGMDVFWLFSVNDTMPQVGCDQMYTRTGDRVIWHYRKFE